MDVPEETKWPARASARDLDAWKQYLVDYNAILVDPDAELHGGNVLLGVPALWVRRSPLPTSAAKSCQSGQRRASAPAPQGHALVDARRGRNPAASNSLVLLWRLGCSVSACAR